MALLISRWRAALAAAVLAFAGLALRRDLSERGRVAAVVLNESEARAVCAAEGFSEAEFWARARAMGAFGALLEPERLGGALRSGAVLRYSQEEIDKLKATRVLAPGTTIEPGSLWIKSAALKERIEASLRALGKPSPALRHAELWVLRLPEGVAGETLSTGFAPERLVPLGGLTPVFLISGAYDPGSARAAAERSVLLVSREYRGPLPSEDAAPLRERKTWLAFADADQPGGIGSLDASARRNLLAVLDAPLGRLLTAGEVAPLAGAAAYLRLAAGRGNALIVARLDAAAGVERNLGALRDALKGLRAAGYSAELSAGVSPSRPPAPAEWGFRLALGFLITVLGPILALRWGVALLRGQQSAGRLPEASPFREAFFAALAVTATGALAGSLAYALLAAGTWRLGASGLEWGPWAAGLTLALSAAALYAPEFSELKVFLRRRPSGGLGLSLALTAFATALLLFTPAWLDGFGPAAWARAAAQRHPALWWAAGRWREWLVGYPCLFVGLCVYFRRLETIREEGSHAQGHDPRPWLLLAMFAPVGLADAFASARVPLELLFLHTLQAAAAGTLLGLPLLAARDGARGS